MYKLKTGRHFERIVPQGPTTCSNTSCNVNVASESQNTCTTLATPNNTSSSLTGGPDSTFPSTTTLTSTNSLNNALSSKTIGSTNYNVPLISHAVVNVELCVDSRLLLVAGASGQVTLFRFVKTESCQDIAVCFFNNLVSFNS